MCVEPEQIWDEIKTEARELAECEPMLASFYHATLLKHDDLGSALSYMLANKLANPIMPAIAVREVIQDAYRQDLSMIISAACDIQAVRLRDPAVDKYSTASLSEGLPCVAGLPYWPLVVERRSPGARRLSAERNFRLIRCRYPPCGENWSWHYA